MLKDISSFVIGSARVALRGNRWYFAWLGFLVLLMLWGVTAWFSLFVLRLTFRPAG